jgi:hypothetical protein
MIDLQTERPAALWRALADFRPAAVGVSLNYLANIPEAIDIAQQAKRILPGVFVQKEQEKRGEGGEGREGREGVGEEEGDGADHGRRGGVTS